jgi:hypothetical protein
MHKPYASAKSNIPSFAGIECARKGKLAEKFFKNA